MGLFLNGYKKKFIALSEVKSINMMPISQKVKALKDKLYPLVVFGNVQETQGLRVADQ